MHLADAIITLKPHLIHNSFHFSRNLIIENKDKHYAQKFYDRSPPRGHVFSLDSCNYRTFFIVDGIIFVALSKKDSLAFL